MKMELDKKLDTIRLNVLAANFGDLATRRQMIQEFGDYPDALWGVNENGEKVTIPRYAFPVQSVCPWMPMVRSNRSMRTTSPTMS